MTSNILFTMAWFYLLVLFLPLSMILLYWKPHLWQTLLALFLGLLAGIVNVASAEVQLPILLLLIFGFFLGFSEPKRAWRWAILIFIFVPLFPFARLIAVHSFEKILPEGFGSFLAAVPAFIGTYAGVFVKSAATRKQLS